MNTTQSNNYKYNPGWSNDEALVTNFVARM